MADINEVVVRGSAAGFAQEILVGRHPLTADEPVAAGGAAPCVARLNKIFRLETERAISDDWVVRYDNRFFQLEPRSENYTPARGQELVCEWPDGRLDIEYRGRAVRWREIAAPTRPPVAERTRVPTPPRAKRKWMPPADHPGDRRRALRRRGG
jgi:hypothetical protein